MFLSAREYGPCPYGVSLHTYQKTVPAYICLEDLDIGLVQCW
jgi:hypothetical protein